MRKGETEHERSEKTRKPLIFYYVAVLLALMLFNMLVVPWVSQNQIIEVDYGTFVSMLGDGRAAEEVKFGTISTGAANDKETITGEEFMTILNA